MAVQLVRAKRVLQRTLSKGRGRKTSIDSNYSGHYTKMTSSTMADVPKGHFAVYVGISWKKRMVIPVSYLNHPLFQELLNKVEEEFGYEHPMGGITIPCTEEYFLSLVSMIHNSFNCH